METIYKFHINRKLKWYKKFKPFNQNKYVVSNIQ
jgi:hypothetical protein